MTALAPFTADSTSLDLSLAQFPETGCAALGRVIDPAKAAQLRHWINERRPVAPSIFYSTREEFEAKGRWERYSPGTRDHNLLLSPELDLRFIEEADGFRAACQALCGSDWQIMKKSIIRSAPRAFVPEWALEFMADVGRPNLNPFVRDEAQDVQYFLTTDFHQDKTRPQSNFVNLYVYLDNVDASYSPLRVLNGTHKLGMTEYPHSLRRSNADKRYWFYSDTFGNCMKAEDILVTGQAGGIFAFHCMTLHGTGYNDSTDPRISLRYLIQKGPNSGNATLLDQANASIIGPRAIPRTRHDVGVDGTLLKTGSSLLGAD